MLKISFSKSPKYWAFVQWGEKFRFLTETESQSFHFLVIFLWFIVAKIGLNSCFSTLFILNF